MRRLTTVLAGVGALLVALGAVFGLFAETPAARVPSPVALFGGVLVVALTLWKLVRSPGGGFAPAPWDEDGAIVDEPPESTARTDPISGTALSGVIEAAASDAREETVEAGLVTVRPPLREALVAALERGGWDRDRIEAALADGSWTDDPVAAAVLDEGVVPPERSLRRRVWAWLFPGKAVRHRTARAVGAVARAADTALPPVVGQRAPRPVPVAEPTLDDLQRAADGSLRRAVDGSASVGADEYEKDGVESGAEEGGAPSEAPDRRDATPETQPASAAGDESAEWTAGGGD
ncbi:DUF7269 family protein [Haloarcula laminariae]|uniref:DUF7269 family protein n=1 Tax=Haloarcula laminariae TaxID=2961577 RepID=UPI002406A4BB|nr:hypothetical protein [Halomicroarcula sp. FL173]